MRNLNLGEMASLATTLAVGGRFLRKTPWLSREQMREWQFARIQLLVTHAVTHIPFYRERYAEVGFCLGDLKTWDDFHRLPVITKDEVIANFPQRMLRTGYDLEKLVVSRSSGSSGKALDICYDSQAMITFSLAGLRLYRMGFPYRPWHRQLYIYTSPYPFGSLFGCYPMHFVPTLAPIPEIAAAVERVRPHLLVAYPSHLRQIAPTLSATARSRLQCVSVNSEMSTQAERNHLTTVLGCPVLDEYSSEELTRIAAQCRHGTYHLFEDINLIETLDSQGQPTTDRGVIVGTNLHNLAMPMIRYVQNDLGRIVEGSCSCGWQFRHLVDLQGRKNDSFLMPSGQEISSGFLLDATYDILLEWRTQVRDFCLIQEARDQILLQVVPGDGWDENLGERIRTRMQHHFEAGVTVTLLPVEACEKTKTGKRNPIIRRAAVTTGANGPGVEITASRHP